MFLFDFFKPKTTEPEQRDHILRLVGTGATAPTVEVGKGITVTRTGTGVYKITWDGNPGEFLGWTFGLGAATPGDIKGHTLIRDTYDATSRSIEISFFNAAEAAHDLAALEYFDLVFRFKETDV